MKRKAQAATRPFRPDALTWIDFLVIGAIALTFLAIASTTVGRAKATPSLDAPQQTQSQPVATPAKAR